MGQDCKYCGAYISGRAEKCPACGKKISYKAENDGFAREEEKKDYTYNYSRESVREEKMAEAPKPLRILKAAVRRQPQKTFFVCSKNLGGKTPVSTKTLEKKSAKELDPKKLAARKRRYRKAEPYIWIAPSLILMCIFIIVPIFYVFATAFGKVDKFGRISGFGGLSNFINVLDNPSVNRTSL